VNSLEQILGTYIKPDENWQSVFGRMSATGALDMKTLTKIVIYLLERFDEYEKHREDDRRYSSDYIANANVGGEDSTVQDRVGEANEEVRPNIESTGTDSDNRTQEPDPAVI